MTQLGTLLRGGAQKYWDERREAQFGRVVGGLEGGVGELGAGC